MIFDAKKVIYSTYSCAISGMSRERMKMDVRDSAECQNWEKKNINGIIEIVKLDNKTKLCIVSSSSNEKAKRKRGGEERRCRRFCFYF